MGIATSRVRRAFPGQWVVSCELCNASGGAAVPGFFNMLLQPLGHAKTWRAAVDYAVGHALQHEATRCPTCLHVPAEPVASTPTKSAR